MKIVNVMNFVRCIDEREENSTERLFDFTSQQLSLVNEYGVENTFLLQYDTVCNRDFTDLFKNQASEKTELGLWYEIVEPLTSACGMPYRSEMGWKWDWHIIPGYSMAYSPKERELLIDEAMRKFKEVLGYYPKTVAGWVIDTHTLNYLNLHYSISAVAICRDQANTDAYTLLGGYFNQAYYPSKNNIFTPAQTKAMQTSVPVFRLLGPCPIHNYDNNKYSSDRLKAQGRRSACFTLEPYWYMGSTEKSVKWMFDSYFSQESLGFAYAQIGQENSFLKRKELVLSGLRMQIEMLLKRGDVEFKKMGETGELFKNRYPEATPPTSVTALNNFDLTDVQSVYYDCKNYTANLFRFEDKVFLRSLFLFDERIEDLYLKNTCTTFDAIYENLPIVDTVNCPEKDKKACGLLIDGNATPFDAKETEKGVLTSCFKDKKISFFEDRIEIINDKLILYRNSFPEKAKCLSDGILFEYKDHSYSLIVEGAKITPEEKEIILTKTEDKIVLYPKKG